MFDVGGPCQGVVYLMLNRVLICCDVLRCHLHMQRGYEADLMRCELGSRRKAIVNSYLSAICLSRTSYAEVYVSHHYHH